MTVRIIVGDCRQRLAALPDASVHCCVTSPPYFSLRSYLPDDHLDKAKEIGLEETPEEFIDKLVSVFREVRRVLRDDGTLWLNMGDTYANDGKWGGSSSGKHVKALHGNTAIGRTKTQTGLKPKNLIGIPWMLAFALRADGWYLRQDIIWAKPNPMPESVTDRCTKAHEYVFLLSKSERYYFDGEAIKEDAVRGYAGSTFDEGKTAVHQLGRASCRPRADAETRNKRSVWSIATHSFSEAHFATFPPALVEPCILAGSPKGGVILDPFFGAGTTGMVSDRLGRDCIGFELNPDYIPMIKRRLVKDAGMFSHLLIEGYPA